MGVEAKMIMAKIASIDWNVLSALGINRTNLPKTQINKKINIFLTIIKSVI